MNESLRETLSDIDGNLSSKRIFTGISYVMLLGLCLVGFIGFMFGLAVNEAILQILLMLALGGQTTIAAERFGKSFNAVPDAPFVEGDVSKKTNP